MRQRFFIDPPSTLVPPSYPIESPFVPFSTLLSQGFYLGPSLLFFLKIPSTVFFQSFRSQGSSYRPAYDISPDHQVFLPPVPLVLNEHPPSTLSRTYNQYSGPAWSHHPFDWDPSISPLPTGSSCLPFRTIPIPSLLLFFVFGYGG